MDGSGRGEAPTSKPGNADELRAAALAMEQAAWREGIDGTGPLGVWVTAMRAALVSLADICDGQLNQAVETVRDAKATTEGELKKLQVARDEAGRLLEQARMAQVGFEVQKEKLIAGLVNTIVPQMVEAVGKAVVIRQVRFNQKVQWGRAAGIAAAALALVLGGFVWGTWAPDNSVAAGALALERIRQCQAAPIKEARTGETFCTLKSLLSAT